MRRRNRRIVVIGSVLILIALGFVFFMQAIASASTNPADLMKSVGEAAGTVVGLVGKRVQY